MSEKNAKFTIRMDFEDNATVALLFGEHNQNLMQIEMYPDPRILAVTGKMLWRFEKTLERGGQGNPYAHAGNFNESEGAVFNWIKVAVLI